MWVKILSSIGLSVLTKIWEYTYAVLERYFKRKKRDAQIDEAFKVEDGQAAAAELDRITGK